MTRALWSASGHLRLCAFDIRDEQHGSAMPHDDGEGVHGVSELESDALLRAARRRVHEGVVEDISAYYFGGLWGREMPVDFAGRAATPSSYSASIPCGGMTSGPAAR